MPTLPRTGWARLWEFSSEQAVLPMKMPGSWPISPLGSCLSSRDNAISYCPVLRLTHYHVLGKVTSPPWADCAVPEVVALASLWQMLSLGPIRQGEADACSSQ